LLNLLGIRWTPPNFVSSHLHVRTCTSLTRKIGDPLRFHSHFLAVGHDWDEEIDLLDIVGGGRLGTGVKKGYLIGGVDPDKESVEADDQHGNVRAFCIEWAAM
jgi:tRNA splicing endonuclease